MYFVYKCSCPAGTLCRKFQIFYRFRCNFITLHPRQTSYACWVYMPIFFIQIEGQTVTSPRAKTLLKLDGPKDSCPLCKLNMDIKYTVSSDYSRSSMARTLKTHLLCLTRTHSLISMIAYRRLPLSNVSKLLFLFSIFSDHWSLKIRNENNSMKTLATEAPYIRLKSLEFMLQI